MKTGAAAPINPPAACPQGDAPSKGWMGEGTEGGGQGVEKREESG